MSDPIWRQSHPAPPSIELPPDKDGKVKSRPAVVKVTIEAEGLHPDTVRQISAFTADLIRKGVNLSGHTNDVGQRILAMQAVQ